MNWRTTVSGIIAVSIAVLTAAKGVISGTAIDWGATMAAVTAGIGLITAKDASTKT